MSFPKYEHYKDSGIEWLGEVPGHWRIAPLKWYSSCRSGDGITSADIESLPDDDHYIPVIGGNGLMGYARAGNTTRPVLAIGRVGALCGNVHEISPPAWISDNALQLQPGEYFSLKYLAEVLRSRNLNDIASKTAQPLITGTQVQDQRLPQPAIDEQEAIVRFLNRETTKLDALITEQRTLIDLLKEKRQAVISHAVTKGLDPRVPMKDSGVEWLGKVPTHWSMTRLGRLADQINDINHEMPSATLGGIPFLSAKDLDDFGGLNFEDDIKTISEEDFDRLSRKICPRKGDIIYSRYGTIGRACVVRTDIRFLVSYSCCIIRVTKANVFLDFLRDLLSSDLILTESKARIRSMGQPDLGLDEIRRFPIPLPPIDEQVAIDRYLKAEVGALDALLSEAEKSVALLQERRSALISAAVTGKIDVRGAIGGV